MNNYKSFTILFVLSLLSPAIAIGCDRYGCDVQVAHSHGTTITTSASGYSPPAASPEGPGRRPFFRGSSLSKEEVQAFAEGRTTTGWLVTREQFADMLEVSVGDLPKIIERMRVECLKVPRQYLEWMSFVTPTGGAEQISPSYRDLFEPVLFDKETGKVVCMGPRGNGKPPCGNVAQLKNRQNPNRGEGEDHGERESGRLVRTTTVEHLRIVLAAPEVSQGYEGVARHPRFPGYIPPRHRVIPMMGQRPGRVGPGYRMYAPPQQRLVGPLQPRPAPTPRPSPPVAQPQWRPQPRRPVVIPAPPRGRPMEPPSRSFTVPGGGPMELRH